MVVLLAMRKTATIGSSCRAFHRRRYRSIDVGLAMPVIISVLDTFCVFGVGCLVLLSRGSQNTDLILRAIQSTSFVIFFLGVIDSKKHQIETGRPGYTQILTAFVLTSIASWAPIIFIESSASITSFIFFVTGGGLALAMERLGMSRAIRALQGSEFASRKIVVYGAGAEGQLCVRRLLADFRSNAGVAVVDKRKGRVPRSIRGVPVWAGVGSLSGFLMDSGCRELIIALPHLSVDRISGVLDEVAGIPIAVKLAVSAIPRFDFTATPTDLSAAAGGVQFLSLISAPLDPAQRINKRLFDLLGATIITLLVVPIMAMIAAAVKYDSPGPILFRQRRVGLGGTTFDVFKFRTLYNDKADPHCAQQAGASDPRVTRVGAFLRATGLDELPQLFNVIRGEMSLVGPRPHAVGMMIGGVCNEELVRGYKVRYSVKPGITGWAQINGSRGPVEDIEALRERVRLDLAYLRDWSGLTDLRIILMTGWKLLLQILNFVVVTPGHDRSTSVRTALIRNAAIGPKRRRRSSLFRGGTASSRKTFPNARATFCKLSQLGPTGNREMPKIDVVAVAQHAAEFGRKDGEVGEDLGYKTRGQYEPVATLSMVPSSKRGSDT